MYKEIYTLEQLEAIESGEIITCYRPYHGRIRTFCYHKIIGGWVRIISGVNFTTSKEMLAKFPRIVEGYHPTLIS